MMETLLSDFLWKKCLVYLDDVIVFGKSFQDCLSNLDEIIGRIHSNGLKLNIKKCKIFQKSITYLGRIISPEGIKADPKKLDAVSNWETPKNPKEVRSFLGFCSYYRDFIPGYSQCELSFTGIGPLDAGKNERSFFLGVWIKRNLLIQDKISVYRDASIEISNCGWSLSYWILMLVILVLEPPYLRYRMGVEVPLAFASNTLNKAQRNYCTTKTGTYWQ